MYNLSKSLTKTPLFVFYRPICSLSGLSCFQINNSIKCHIYFDYSYISSNIPLFDEPRGTTSKIKTQSISCILNKLRGTQNFVKQSCRWTNLSRYFSNLDISCWFCGGSHFPILGGLFNYSSEMYWNGKSVSPTSGFVSLVWCKSEFYQR